MYERLNKSRSNALAYRISRPLTRQEVSQLADEIEGTIHASGKIRVLLDLQSFPYAEMSALWEDLKFDVKHGRDLERLALVGGNTLENVAARFFSALSGTRCRCFAEGEVDQAWDWLIEETD